MLLEALRGLLHLALQPLEAALLLLRVRVLPLEPLQLAPPTLEEPTLLLRLRLLLRLLLALSLEQALHLFAATLQLRLRRRGRLRGRSARERLAQAVELVSARRILAQRRGELLHLLRSAPRV